MTEQKIIEIFEDRCFSETIPAEDIVLRMSKVYKWPSLPLEHLFENTLIGQLYFNQVEVETLPISFLKLQKEMDDVAANEKIIRSCVIDDVISVDEEIIIEKFLVEAQEVAFAALSFCYSVKNNYKNCKIGIKKDLCANKDRYEMYI